MPGQEDFISMTDAQRQKIADYVRNYLLRTAQSYGHKNGFYRATARWMHCLNVVNNVNLILDGENADPTTREICEIAAMFHDIDHYTVSQEYHAQRGAETASRFLLKEGFDPALVARIAVCVQEHDHDLDDERAVDEQVAEIVERLPLDARMVMDADTLDKIGASNILQSALTMGLSKRTVADAAKELTSGWPLQRARLWKEMLTTETGKKMGEQRLTFYEQFLTQVRGEVITTDPYQTEEPAQAQV
jgi:HD superfamily phosphodiesterase